VKRFLKTSAFLVVSLFLLVSGVDTALDHLTHSTTQNSFTVYSERGGIILAYEGDLSVCKAYAKPCPVVTTGFFHRT